MLCSEETCSIPYLTGADIHVKDRHAISQRARGKRTRENEFYNRLPQRACVNAKQACRASKTCRETLLKSVLHCSSQKNTHLHTSDGSVIKLTLFYTLFAAKTVLATARWRCKM